MINKNELDFFIENKEFEKINKLFINEFKILFQQLTGTQDKNLSFSNLSCLIIQKYPDVSEKLEFLSYLLSDNDINESEKTYDLLNLYLNFVKFYTL